MVLSQSPWTLNLKLKNALSCLLAMMLMQTKDLASGNFQICLCLTYKVEKLLAQKKEIKLDC